MALFSLGQEQYLLLNDRWQQQQVHNLRDPRPGDVPQPCQFRMCFHLADL